MQGHKLQKIKKRKEQTASFNVTRDSGLFCVLVVPKQSSKLVCVVYLWLYVYSYVCTRACYFCVFLLVVSSFEWVFVVKKIDDQNEELT